MANEEIFEITVSVSEENQIQLECDKFVLYLESDEAEGLANKILSFVKTIKSNK